MILTDIFVDSGDWDCSRPGPSSLKQMHVDTAQVPLSRAAKGTVSLWTDGHVKLIKPYNYPVDPCL
ncbi:MAG: hypothetical protein QM758_21200 [Armatimonas sp.]